MAAPEKWTDIAGYEKLYQVSSLGRIWSTRRKRLRVLGRHSRGYAKVTLHAPGRKPRSFLVHRLVAAAFIGPIPTDRQVNHDDGHKKNNVVSNLQILTPKQNREHAKRTGLSSKNHVRGEQVYQAKLTAAQVAQIRVLYERCVPVNELAALFGVSVATIRDICYRKTWKHVA